MQDWIGPYQEEFNQVKNRRLEQITDKDKIDDGSAGCDTDIP